MDQKNMKFAALLAAGCAAMAVAGCATTSNAGQSELAVEADAPTAVMSEVNEPQAEPQEQAEGAYSATLCEAGEDTLFAGSVNDDFGLGLAVCRLQGGAFAEDRITAVWSGEGGTSRTTCFASKCGEVMRFSRYTRYRYTLLSLTWVTDGHVHTIDETFDAEDMSTPPKSIVHYFWESEWTRENNLKPTSDRIDVRTEPLSLMALARILEVEGPETQQEYCPPERANPDYAGGCEPLDEEVAEAEEVVEE